MLRAVPAAVLAIFGVVCAVALARVAATLGLHVSFDPNEGWNAYHAAAAMAGRPLYPAPQSYFVNNYPPLSFYVVGAVGRLLGDQIIAGRLVALLAFFAVVGGIAIAARRIGATTVGALLGAMLFAAMLLIGSDYVGMDDPQMLGHALAMAALLSLLRGRDGVAAALFVIALFVKHNLVAMPLAAAAWMLLVDGNRAWRFAAFGLGYTLIGLAAFRIAFGSSLFAHLASARIYQASLLAQNAGHWLIWAAVPLAITGLVGGFYRHDRHVALIALYAGIAVAIGLAFSGGAGVDTNVFFDADIAVSLGVALALGRFAARDAAWPALFAAALLVPLASGLYLAADGVAWRESDYWLHPLADEAAQARGDIAFLKAHPGPALCETLALCYWAGKPAAVDVFNVGQEFAGGTRRDGALVRRIESRAYAAVEFDSLSPFALTPAIRAALLAHYRIDHANDEGVFLVPRP